MQNETDIANAIVERKRRKRPEQDVQAEPGDNTKYLNHSLAMLDWPAVDLNNNAQVSARVHDYFQLCADDDMKPSVEGLAVALGTDRRRIWEIVNEKSGGKPREVTDTLKRAYTILTAQMANYMQNGKINPVAGIFLMKNNMGYKDQTDVVVTPNNPLGDITDPQTIAGKYEVLPEE